LTTVELAIDALERGDVPALSFKTGKPCANPVGVRLRVGLRRVYAVLPVEAGRARLRRVLGFVSYALLIAAIVLAFVAWPAAIAVAVVYGADVVAGELVWIGSREGASTDTIRLTRVHPDFAAALSR
jgi:hypothetical protein